MGANPNLRTIDNPAWNGGLVWTRLHSEREEICDVLLNESVPGSETAAAATVSTSKDDALRNATWHTELLHARLSKIDDALDRLMSGSYGNCSKCRRRIEDTKLDLDPAIAFCAECWAVKQSDTQTMILSKDNSYTSPQDSLAADVLDHSNQGPSSRPGFALDTLAAFDTISVHTRNSDYRIFLLDPKTGRALVEGGQHFPEPVEAMLCGDPSSDGEFEPGCIGIGRRLEMWADDKFVSTSAVQSIRIEHGPIDPTSMFMSAML